MTREELKKHCEKQIENCEMWAKYKGEKPSSKVYEEHKLILELLEQEPILDRVREEIVDTLYVDSLIFGELIDFRNGKISADDVIEEFNRVTRLEVLQIIDKYKAESEG